MQVASKVNFHPENIYHRGRRAWLRSIIGSIGRCRDPMQPGTGDGGVLGWDEGSEVSGLVKRDSDRRVRFGTVESCGEGG